VIVSVVHLLRGTYAGIKLLDNRPAERITAFLFSGGISEDPRPLKCNAGKSFLGAKLYGQGFTFDDSCLSDDETPGIPSPIATMKRLIEADSSNKEVILPYMGGK
jgi:hypothetical protein